MKIVFIVSLLLLSSLAFSAPKKKACKELKISQCKKRPGCTWIKKSKRKDGKVVKAYCRKNKKK